MVQGGPPIDEHKADRATVWVARRAVLGFVILAFVPRTEVEGRWRGHRTLLVDGSSFSMPDTPGLQRHFGQPGNQAAGCGFPTAKILALFHWPRRNDLGMSGLPGREASPHVPGLAAMRPKTGLIG